jgi:predicted PurR-regulated permease PerM
VLAAVSVGGGLGGVGGMLVAVPITATAYTIVHEWVQKKRNSAKKEET